MSAELSQDLADLLEGCVVLCPCKVGDEELITILEKHKEELEAKKMWTEIKQTIEVEIIRRKKLGQFQQKEEKVIRDLYWDLRMLHDTGCLICRQAE